MRGAADIICIRMNLPVGCRPSREALRDPLRETQTRSTRRWRCWREARWRILAGGTDFYPAQGSRPLARKRARHQRPRRTARHLRDRRRMSSSARARPGPTSSAIALPPAFDALKQAAREVGSVQIQNVGIGRRQSVQRLAGRRRRAAAAGARRGGRAALARRRRAIAAARRLHPRQPPDRAAAGEMVTAIRIPQGVDRRRVHLPEARRAALSRHLDRHGGGADRRSARTARIEQAAIAVGSCSAVAQRLPALEAALVGLQPGRDIWPMPSQAADLAELVADRRRARQRRLSPRGGARDRARALVAAHRPTPARDDGGMSAHGHAIAFEVNGAPRLGVAPRR